MANTSASDVKHQAGNLAGQAADKARDLASSANQAARDTASNLGQRAEDLTGRLASGMSSMGETIRQHAPREGYLGQAADRVASGIESGGRYLEREGLSGMTDDLSTLIKNNPIPSLLVGFGLGFLLARLTRS
jgi:hypothetical protein